VYGGSELYRLIDTDPAKRCGCSWCHEGCAVLTPERIATLNKENIYTSLARFTQKESVVDTSKNLPWFEDVFPRQNAEEVSPSMIVLSKHPLRQLAAYMGWEQNYLYRCGLRSVLKRAFLDPATALSRERMHLSYWLDVMGEFYSAIDRSRMLRGMPRWNVRYEDFVTGTAQALVGPLEFLGLEYLPEAVEYHTFEQHGVGGNDGVMRMATTEERKKRFRARSADYLLEFYDNCTGLMLDNSYRNAFSKRTLAWIMDHPKYRALCERLGYDEHAA
jgi:hypothetical protein